jgi:ABC-type phosphate/phosphonate transport system substrate-binding protein
MAATSAVSTVARAHVASDAPPPPLRFAVLAFRPPAEMLKRWQPLTSYLEQHIDSHRVELRALSYPELEQAVHDRQVDIVLTQPAHYVALSVLENLYSPLASLVELEQGQALTQFGGVVIVKANDTRLQRLADLKGKRIATSSVESLGAFQAQAYELLRLGIDRSDFSLIETGQQDAVLQALADGQADAGFVRSGLLEQMAREGKVDSAAYRVLAADEVPNYPMQLSTRLYPQWALAAMPWLDPVIARQVAAAVLSLPHDGEIARAARISGFSVPGAELKGPGSII